MATAAFVFRMMIVMALIVPFSVLMVFSFMTIADFLTGVMTVYWGGIQLATIMSLFVFYWLRDLVLFADIFARWVIRRWFLSIDHMACLWRLIVLMTCFALSMLLFVMVTSVFATIFASAPAARDTLSFRVAPIINTIRAATLRSGSQLAVRLWPTHTLLALSRF